MRFRFDALAGLVIASTAIIAHADGTVDTSFGTSGLAVTGITNGIPGAPRPGPVVQADGKILIAGTVDDSPSNGFDMSVMRFDANGTLDLSFSLDGRAVVSFADNMGSDVCSALALQADGKILLAGFTQSFGTSQDFAIARFNADGTLDTTGFGAGTGKVTVAFNLGGTGSTNDDYATSIAVQRDGKIVVAGVANKGNDDFAIARLNADGTLDTSFNGTGKKTIGFDIFLMGSTFNDVANAVAVDSQNRIIVAGTAENESNNTDFAVARLLSNGTLDTAFNSTGKQIVPFDRGGGNADTPFAVTVQHGDKIVLAGAVQASAVVNSFDIGLARLQTDGALDTTFGTGGKVILPIDLVSDGGDFASGVVEQGNGKLLLTGYVSGTSGSVYLMAARLQSGGSLDSTFGSSGITLSLFGSSTYNPSFGVALQGTQIILGGIMFTGSNYDFFVARLTNDLIFADRFE